MGMIRLGRSATALVLIASLGLAACQTTGTNNAAAPLTPAEQQLRDEADVFNETVAGGAVTGAIIGGLLGALAGAASGKSENILTGAAIGAAAGGILGGVDGYMTAKAQESANNQVRMLNSMADDVRKDNARLQRLVSNSNQVLADSKQRLEQIKADVATKKLTVAQAKNERSKIEQNQALLAQTLKTATEKRDNYRDAAAQMRAQGGNTKSMDAEIARLEKEIDKLENNVSSLNTALEVTRVG
jgi:archaellum component FlaC